jgi:hypothetical protein
MFDSPLKLMALLAAFMVLWSIVRNRQITRRYAPVRVARRRQSAQRWL